MKYNVWLIIDGNGCECNIRQYMQSFDVNQAYRMLNGLERAYTGTKFVFEVREDNDEI